MTRCEISENDVSVSPSIIGVGLTAQQISCPRGDECPLQTAIDRPHMEYPGADSRETVLRHALWGIRKYCEMRQIDNKRLAAPLN